MLYVNHDVITILLDCCFADNAMNRAVHHVCQRNSRLNKFSLPTVVCLTLVVILVCYLTYRTVLKPQASFNRSPQSPATSLQRSGSRLTTMASWAKSFIDLPRGWLEIAQGIDVVERSVTVTFEGQVSIYVIG